ncbi:MAG: hypothetical protein WAV38_09590, partial [Xanthobacteraceae bacterium]
FNECLFAAVHESLAQSGHLDCAEGCPLLGVKRTLQFDRAAAERPLFKVWSVCAMKLFSLRVHCANYFAQ